MTKLKKASYYRANQGFATVDADGENVFVKQGEIFSAGHPLMKGREWAFEPVEDFGRFDLSGGPEQATAAPGEKRGAKPSK
jgi:cold shock CspA family protein